MVFSGGHELVVLYCLYYYCFPLVLERMWSGDEGRKQEDMWRVYEEEVEERVLRRGKGRGGEGEERKRRGRGEE